MFAQDTPQTPSDESVSFMKISPMSVFEIVVPSTQDWIQVLYDPFDALSTIARSLSTHFIA